MAEEAEFRPDLPEKRSGTELFQDRVRFRRPFEGEPLVVDASERDAVARKFSSTVTDTLLKHIEDVKSIGGSDSVFLNIDLDQDNILAVTVSRDGNTGDNIHIQHEIGDKGKENFTYRVDESGTVVRFDSRGIPHITEIFEKFKEMPREEMNAYFANLRGNSDLEEGMRFNNQPIGLDEIQGAIELVNEAKPRTDLDL